MIYGNLLYVPEYKDFSGDPSMQKGHYLVLDFASTDAEKIETMITGGTMQEYVDATADKYCVYLVRNNSQTIKVKVTKGGQSEEIEYKLSDLRLL